MSRPETTKVSGFFRFRRPGGCLPAGIALALLCLLGLAAVWLATKPDQSGLGEKLPGLAFETMDKTPVLLDQYRGKVLLINFWAPWCVPCLQEMPSLQALHDQLDAGQYQLIGITEDEDRHLVAEFLLDNAINFPQLFDVDKVMNEHPLNVRALPVTLIVDRDLRIRQRFVGERDWASADMRHYLTAAGAAN